MTSTYYLDSGINNCTENCPSGTFENPINHICTVCTSPCATCNVNGTDCQSCIDSTYLFGNTCPSNCPSGYFKINGSNF